ncbi:MAG: 2-dehydropantoate 2-reductase [Dokdonella sp.]
MRILVLGAGAIGGFFGARLIESGHVVDFLVREGSARRLRGDGLRLVCGSGDFSSKVSCVSEVDFSYDLILLSCKAYDLDSAISAITPAVGEQSRVLPLLNGLRHLEPLDAAFGRGNVLGGFAHISVTLRADGVIEQFGDMARLVYGPRGTSDVPAAIAEALQSMRADVIPTPAILSLMWQKFALIASLAGATCLCRASVGDILSTTDGRELIERLYRECCATSEASGHALTDQMQEEALAALTTRTPLKASMLRDIERGHRSEGEHIVGDMLRRANTFKIDTPILLAAATHLRIYDRAVQAHS